MCVYAFSVVFGHAFIAATFLGGVDLKNEDFSQNEESLSSASALCLQDAWMVLVFEIEGVVD
jgi:hypothetical protein